MRFANRQQGIDTIWYRKAKRRNLCRRKKGFPWGSVGKGDYNAPCLCRFKQLKQSCWQSGLWRGQTNAKGGARDGTIDKKQTYSII